MEILKVHRYNNELIDITYKDNNGIIRELTTRSSSGVHSAALYNLLKG